MPLTAAKPAKPARPPDVTERFGELQARVRMLALHVRRKVGELPTPSGHERSAWLKIADLECIADRLDWVLETLTRCD